ncbi:MAG TPA: PhzF family phenazine biosynthesis protein [Candidatus Udaeobacter sp.]|nr:PhzF family phenazine biosynthesis protein [Candidatus Udaeobacter sp.]
MSRAYEFVQLDVFTRMPLTGNPLAIFTDARGLSDDQMQALAREMNLSETTFILPREREVEAKEGKRVRIFTVEEELPFAGHPTLGTALYLHNAAPCNEIVLDLNVGKIGVSFRADSNDKNNRVGGDVFGEMRQRDPEFGPTLPRDKIASVLQRDGAEQIASEWPSQIVSTGLPFAIVPIRDSKSLANLKPDLARVGTLLEGTGAKFCYFISHDEREGWREVRARMFFYGGEDPATGSAAGCAVSWIVRHGLAKSDEPILIRQGIEMGRPSELFVRATRAPEKVINVRVGGYAVEVLRGTVVL